jgi:hypothetical protein
MDFTLKIYKNLLKSLQNAGFSFETFEEYLEETKRTDLQKIVVLRHDVDALPENSLEFAKIQSGLGIFGTYYFRAVPQSWNENIIREIAALGHEVGYHYENMDAVSSKFTPWNSERIFNGVRGQRSEFQVQSSKFKVSEKLLDLAYEDFKMNMEKLRKLVPVNTICMHGSPRSKYDNKAIWEKYDYKNLGITGEPYFDVDLDKTFYLTDTGRRWDGRKVSVRDKVPQQEEWNQKGLVFHSTTDIINAISTGKTLGGTEMPVHIMFTFHPQRWHSKSLPWLRELFCQNVKNLVKRWGFVKRKN